MTVLVTLLYDHVIPSYVNIMELHIRVKNCFHFYYQEQIV